MVVLDAGSDLAAARNELKMSQTQLAAALDVSLATIKRHEKSSRLDVIVALAVESLLRRARPSNAPVSPEERAERKFREREHLRKLHEQAGLTMRGPGRPAKPLLERAIGALDLQEEKRRIRGVRTRNRLRAEQRSLIASLHASLAMANRLNNGTMHRALLDKAIADCTEQQMYLTAYIELAEQMPVPDDSPLVTLPEESI